MCSAGYDGGGFYGDRYKLLTHSEDFLPDHRKPKTFYRLEGLKLSGNLRGTKNSEESYETA
jgi:hypothetical protein